MTDRIWRDEKAQNRSTERYIHMMRKNPEEQNQGTIALALEKRHPRTIVLSFQVLQERCAEWGNSHLVRPVQSITLQVANN